MADTKISALVAGNPAQSSDAIPIARGGTNFQITAGSIAALSPTLDFQGTWDATTNTPALASGVGTTNHYYVVSTAGTTTLDGISIWSVGDWASFNGSIWQKLCGSVAPTFNTAIVNTLLTSSGNTLMGDPGTEGAGILFAGINYDANTKINDIASANTSQLILHRHSTTVAPNLLGARSNSNTAAHAAVTAAQKVLGIYGTGWAGTNGYELFGGIDIAVSSLGSISNASSPGKITLSVTQNAANTMTPVLTMDSDLSAVFAGTVAGSSFNKLTLTTPATGSTLTIADGKVLTASNTLTFAGTDSSTLNIGTGGTLGTAAYTAATAYLAAGATAVNSSLLLGATWAAPAAIGTGTPAAVTGTTITANTGFVGPLNGIVGGGTPAAGTFTTVNKLTLTTPATGSTLTILDGKTLTVSNILTLAGTDSTTMTFPTTSATLARTDAGNTFTGNQTLGDPANIVLGTVTGTKIGTATTQKLAFFNSTPIVQPANTVAIDTALVNLGLRATGGVANFATVTTYPGTYGTIYVSDGVTAQTVATGTTPTLLTCWNTATGFNGVANDITPAKASNKITVTRAGTYRVAYNFSYTCNTDLTTWEFYCFNGGAEAVNMGARFTSAVGLNNVTVSATGYFAIAANADIDVRAFHSLGGNSIITINHANLNIQYLGA